MTYIAITILLALIQLAYFRIADLYNIIDKPNERSSHTRTTIRGGGVIFPLGVLLWVQFTGFPFPWFTIGLLIISMISLWDDIRPLPNRIRIIAHLLAVALLAGQTGLFDLQWYWWIAAFILITGTINAFNFMDGVNAMTSFYSHTCLAGFFLINLWYPFTESGIIIVVAIALTIFAYFNAREKAVAFAGDVGSVSIAFILCFLLMKLIITTANPAWILLFAVYGVDTVLTIIHRLLKGENIFRAHRSHLYQYMANENNMPHVLVSSIYSILQLLVTGITIYIIFNNLLNPWLLVAIVLGILGVIYIVVKSRMIFATSDVSRNSRRHIA